MTDTVPSPTPGAAQAITPNPQPENNPEAAPVPAQEPDDAPDLFAVEADDEPGAAAAEDDAEALDLSDYRYQPPDGQELAPGAEKSIDALAAFSARNGIAPEQFSGLVDFYNGLVEQHKTQRAATDKMHLQEVHAHLREVWGHQFEGNWGIAREGVRTLPTTLRRALKEARLPDGRLLANLPELSHLFFELGRKAGAEFVDVATDETRIKDLRLNMREDFDRYIRRNEDKELARLLERQTKRAAADDARAPGDGDAAREAEIRRIMKTDVERYWREGLDRELTAILTRRGA